MVCRTVSELGGRLRDCVLVFSLLLYPAGIAHAQAPTMSGALPKDDLEAEFLAPPPEAHPRVWWHWMNGNITQPGIALDLAWMHRVGIAGFENFDVAVFTPKVVKDRLAYMTPEWQNAFRYAIKTGESYGFEMGVAGSPGWSESGGPWVKPQDGMKKVTWSAFTIDGGKAFHGVLPPPPKVTGPFGDIDQQDPLGQLLGGPPPTPYQFAADTVVVAFPESVEERPTSELHPTLTTSSGSAVDAAKLWDGSLNGAVSLPPAKPGETSWLQYEFSSAVTIRAVTLALGRAPLPIPAFFLQETNDGPILESSDDGKTFVDVVRMPTCCEAQHTLDFPPVTARFFRLAFKEKASPAAPSAPGAQSTAQTHEVVEFDLHQGPRVNRFEEKAAFEVLPEYYSVPTPAVADGEAIASKQVIDLTSRVAPDGVLTWAPPPGRWTIITFGYSLTGITNHPAPLEATGLEVDKLDARRVTDYMNHYLDTLDKATEGDIGSHGSGKGLKFITNDSWESGPQNWTDNLLSEFKKRRGYDALPWLPALTGRVVGNSSQSDAFLWDYRRTLAELLAENHYSVLNRLIHARGMSQYAEAHEDSRVTIGDGMEMKSHADVPMAAMWVQAPGVNTPQLKYDADIRESASVAHIYGRPYVAAESLTTNSAPWFWSPWKLKPTVDEELLMGLNRFAIHSSVHQPLTGPDGGSAGSPAPGLSLGPYGQWFNRNEIWAEQAKPWVDYLSRCSYLLQQGQFVADVAYFYGEDSNVSVLFKTRTPDVPEGLNYDYVNADIIQHRLRVDKGDLVTTSGMRYRVLALDRFAAHMSLPVLRQIAELVKNGATVVGNRPIGDPSLADDQALFNALTLELWGNKATAVRHVGKGRVITASLSTTTDDLSEAFKALGLIPDTEYAAVASGTKVMFVHRRTANSDIYFVANRSSGAVETSVTFRIKGKAAELFDPETGKSGKLSYSVAHGRTSVPLSLSPWATVFVVFRHGTNVLSYRAPKLMEQTLAEMSGPWDLKFEEDRGAPKTLHMAALSSWTDNQDPAVRYFSGHGLYSKHFQAKGDWHAGTKRVWLDLGNVAELADVSLNGIDLGTLWKPPFKIDITSALRDGDNFLQVRVANLWVNRLIGDAQPNVVKKFTFTVGNPYKADSPLIPAGLLGPVSLFSEEHE